MKTGGLSHPRKLRSRQGYAFSALFPEIRDLSTMKGLLDLKWQGYGFRAANLCFKAHCCDVIVRAGRDALSLDLQKLVHEDMAKDFAAYPKTWSTQHPDANIDHRRVPNLETFWRRAGCELWRSSGTALGNGFPGPLAVGDILTWRLDARWPHVGMVVADSLFSTRIVHNWGNGAEESALLTFAPHRAIGHYRWSSS